MYVASFDYCMTGLVNGYVLVYFCIKKRVIVSDLFCKLSKESIETNKRSFTVFRMTDR